MWKRLIGSILVAFILLVSCKDNKIPEINISVASSLLEPMEEIVKQYENDNNINININSGASGELKNQILQGAEVGLYFSANEEYVDDLIVEGMVNKEDKNKLLSNSLVLIKNKSCNEELGDILDLKKTKGTIAIGEVNLVPAGEYTKEALVNIGLWNEIQDKIIYAKSVNVVKTYVENGNVDYGFVYKSDARNLKNSSIVFDIAYNTHSKITYSLTVLNNYKYKNKCNDLMDYLMSKESLEIFEKYGFSIEG